MTKITFLFLAGLLGANAMALEPAVDSNKVECQIYQVGGPMYSTTLESGSKLVFDGSMFTQVGPNSKEVIEVSSGKQVFTVDRFGAEVLRIDQISKSSNIRVEGIHLLMVQTKSTSGDTVILNCTVRD
jgi:hypothetical protein